MSRRGARGPEGDAGRRRGRLPPRGRQTKGGSLEEIWRHLVGEVGGEIAYDRRDKPVRATIPHREWRLVLDIHQKSSGEGTQTFTRVRALFVRQAPFRLRVTRRTPFHRIGEWFGFRAVDVGYNRVDRTLFVRSDRAAVARTMLRGTSLGQALLKDPKQSLRVQAPSRRIRHQAAATIGEVQVLKSGRIKDLTVLRSLAQIGMWTLDELVRAHVALPDPVADVRL